MLNRFFALVTLAVTLAAVSLGRLGNGIAATGTSTITACSPEIGPILHESEVTVLFLPVFSVDPDRDIAVFQGEGSVEVVPTISNECAQPYAITIVDSGENRCLLHTLCSANPTGGFLKDGVKFLPAVSVDTDRDNAVFHGHTHGTKVLSGISKRCSTGSGPPYGIAFTGSADDHENWSLLDVLCSANSTTSPTPTNGTYKPSSPPANDSTNSVPNPSLDTSAYVTIADALWWIAGTLWWIVVTACRRILPFLMYCSCIISLLMGFSEYRHVPEAVEIANTLTGMALLAVFTPCLLIVWEFFWSFW